jgi:hypothetical protein
MGYACSPCVDAGVWSCKMDTGRQVKNRLHLDVIAADPEVEIARLVELGATRVADRDEYGYTWTLMADPEGNEFDLGKAL